MEKMCIISKHSMLFSAGRYCSVISKSQNIPFYSVQEDIAMFLFRLFDGINYFTVNEFSYYILFCVQ